MHLKIEFCPGGGLVKYQGNRGHSAEHEPMRFQGVMS